MSDQELNQFGDLDDLDQDNLDGENLFNEVNVDDDNKSQQKKTKKLKKHKKEKKSKKEKKQKKKKRRYQQQQDLLDEYDDEEEDERNSMFEDEAQSQSQQENYDQDISAQIGQDQEDARYKQMMNKASTRDNYYKKFDGKNDREINALYSRGVNMLRQNQAMYPGENDPKLYIVLTQPRHEDQIVLYLLNKAKYKAQTENKVTVVSAISMKKKHPGRIFVQAFSEKDVKDSLDGFNHVNLNNIKQLERQGYAQLFNEKFETKTQYQPLNYVRITKGLYEGDLAQIIKVRANNTVDVTIVPRLNIQQIALKIKQQTSKIVGQEARSKKMAELLTLFLNHKTNNFRKRPNKQTISQQELRQQLGDNPAVKKIKLAGNPPGLIILNYRVDEITQHKGTFNPVEIMPFTPEGNFIGKINQEKSSLTTATSFKKGQEVQIVSGGMLGHWGIIYEIVENVAIIICKNKQLKGQRIQQSVQHIMKRFKQGQRVKVISGADTGKTGIVLKVQQKTVQIWTDNQNSIKVNKKNLQVSKTQLFNQQNVHNLNKDDLIKTSKNQIGIVVETTKDNIKILDTNNTIQVIGNMDFDSKVNSRNIVAKNRSGDQITAGCTVILRQGVHQGKKCKVIHVYRQNLFLFNAAFNRTAGVAVQNAQNCSLISKNQPVQPRNYSIKASNSTVGTTDNKDQITIGKVIIIKTGPLKGYQGIVKGFNKDKIQVRVPSKSCTEWIPRQNVGAKKQTMQIGKTPNRKIGNTHNYVPSPSRY